MLTPIADSYWVLEGSLLAGEYPGAKQKEAAEAKLSQFLTGGFDFFLDLTEAGEHGLEPYADRLTAIAAGMRKRVTHRRMPIRDVSTPSFAQMIAILDTLDAALAEKRRVYVHCWGGIGRTGTVVGCFLVRRGMGGPDALSHIEQLRRGTPDAWRTSPETDAQCAMVLAWQQGQ